MFGRKKDDSDTLLADENEEFYNPAATSKRVEDDSDLLPVDEEDEPEEEEAPKKKERKSKAKRYGRAVVEEDEEEEPEPDASEWASPVKPSLSLPSRSIVEQTLRNGAAIRMRKVAVIVSAGLAAALVTCAGLNILSAGQLSGVKAQGETLAKSVEAMQPIAQFYDGYTARREAVSTALTTDIEFSKVQNSLFSAADKNGVNISSETVVPGQPCASMDPFVESVGLGCITVAVTGSSTANLAAFSDSLKNELGLNAPYLSGISSKDGEATASLSVNYGDELLSARYTKFGSGSKPADPSGTTAPPTS